MGTDTRQEPLSPLDGRYAHKTSELRQFFSEESFLKYRVRVEILYLLQLVDFLGVEKVAARKAQELVGWSEHLSGREVSRIKTIENKVAHDVKAIEIFVGETLKKKGLSTLTPWVHWGLTSEDTNNLAYGLMIRRALIEVVVPTQLQLLKKLVEMAEKWKKLVMPARTHGQVAVPTTMGKEMVVFAARMAYWLEEIGLGKMGGKMGGAVGNLNAHRWVYPQKDWLAFSREFVESLGLEYSLATTQIEPGMRLVHLMDLLREYNLVCLDFARDMWMYISRDYFFQKSEKRETGSSTMPHKINPIRFENAEGNVLVANALIGAVTEKLTQSRLQRDLSDSTVKRNIGIVFGYSLLSVKSLDEGLQRILPHDELMTKNVVGRPDMLAEPLQLLLRTRGSAKAYEQVKSAVRGRRGGWEDLIAGLIGETKKEVQSWQVERYTGFAEEITTKECRRIQKIITKIEEML